MAWEVWVAPRATKDLDDVPARDRPAVEAAIASLPSGLAAGKLVKLSGQGDRWRQRIGNWRVIVELDKANGRINVVAVRPRNERTYRD
jgi:mRNA-degrading endonuclease RelE of RelBE toxin-antitoxin system